MTSFGDLLLDWRERYPPWRVDRIFTFVFFALPAAAGSAVSFMLGGAFLWAMLRFGRRDFALKMPQPLLVCMMIFAGYFGLNAISALSRGMNMAALEPVLKTLPFLLVSLIAARLRNARSADLTDVIIVGSALGAVFGAIVGIVDSYILNTWRVEGGAGNSGIFGVISLLLAFLALGGLFKKSRTHQSFAILGFACGIFALHLSGSRALIVYVPVLFAVFLIFWVPTRAWGKLGMGVTIAGTVLVAIGTFSAFHHKLGSMVKEMTSVSRPGATESSGGKRMIMYRAAWDAFVEHPLLGYGPQNLMHAIEPHIPHDKPMGVERFSHLHSHLLDDAVGSGLPGVIGLLAVFFAPIWTAFQTNAEPENKLIRYLILVSVLAFFLNGLTNITFRHDIISSLYLYSVVAILCSGRYRNVDVILFYSKHGPCISLLDENKHSS